MRISPEHYEQLKHAIVRVLDMANPAQTDLDARAMRSRWDLLHASGFDTRILYADGLNDDHIDTALRRIVKTWCKERTGSNDTRSHTLSRSQQHDQR